MGQRDELLKAFRASYDRVIRAREGGDEREIRHAEVNFHIAAEVIAKRVPYFLSESEAQLRSVDPAAKTA